MIGKTILHYNILERLGEGGMGVVYLAEDTKLERKVAIKFLPGHISANSEEIERFKIEAKAAAILNHPNICNIHTIEEENDCHFIVMEYVDGINLSEKIKNAKLKINDAISYAVQMGEALQEAHANGIIHRDIKPDNIMINSKNQVKVMDFGLAKIKGSIKLTKTSSTVGTLAYMSPEQIQNGEIDARSDIFSFGIVLFEMLTGYLPFKGNYDASLMYTILNEEPEPLQKYLPDANSELIHIINKALEKDPGERYQTIKEMIIDLRRIKKLSNRVFQVSSKKNTGYYAFIVAATVCIILAVAAYFFFYNSNQEENNFSLMKITRFTSYNGEEYFPTLSPDGKYVAFSWNGPNQDNFDVYVKLVSGGNPVRLTSNSLVDSRPEWSPDGNLIAFVRGFGNLPVVKARNEIYIIPALGGREQKIVNYFAGAGGEQPSISWSHDSKFIYFTHRAEKDYNYAIFKVSIETQKIELVVPFPKGFQGVHSPRISPDGNYVGYIRRALPSFSDDIFVKNLNNNKVRRITNVANRIDGFSWGRDSRSIFFSCNIDGTSGLWKQDLNENKLEKVMSGININNPYVSVSGNRLVYAETIGNSNIWKIDLHKPQKETMLINSSAFENGNPDISPDGKKIIFSSNRTGAYNIWMCERDGTNQTQLTSFDDNRGRTIGKWSPNGLEILFSCPKGIYILKASGGIPKKIGSLWTDPVWSEDGTGFYCGEFSINKLFYFSRNGKLKKQVTKDFGIRPYLYGKYIYYLKNWTQHDIWRIPVKGGKEEPVLQGVADIKVSSWIIAKKGIYYIRSNKGSPVLEFFDFMTKKISHIKDVPMTEIENLNGVPSIAIDPAETNLLYSKREPNKSDIILADNFR